MFTVSGLGQASLDTIVLTRGFPEEDSKKEVEEIVVQGGGPVATALVSLSRLGVRTRFSGVVSDDPAGREIRRGLRVEGVDTGHLVVRKGALSQRAFIVVNLKKGTRTILWKRPTAEALRPDELKRSFLRGADFLLLDGLMKEASLEAARRAGAAGVPVMIDAGRLRPGMLALCRLSRYIVASEEFSRALAPTHEDTLVRLSRYGPSSVTITLGPRGSVTWAGGRVFYTPAFKVRAVDTTGAGDVFHGGYIYGLLSGWSIERTVTFASAFAALKCRHPGGRTGIPTLEETLRFMNSSQRRRA